MSMRSRFLHSKGSRIGRARPYRDHCLERAQNHTQCRFPNRLLRPLLAAVRLRLDEAEQVRVELILMRRGEAVRSARVVDFLGALDESG